MDSYWDSVPISPATYWRAKKEEERRKFATGEVDVSELHLRQQLIDSGCSLEEASGLVDGQPFMERYFPDDFIERTDALLQTYVQAISQCGTDSDSYPQIMQCIETLVLALNEFNALNDGPYEGIDVIETDEREMLCAYIDQVIVERGVDIDALASSQNLGRHELTDKWREW